MSFDVLKELTGNDNKPEGSFTEEFDIKDTTHKCVVEFIAGSNIQVTIKDDTGKEFVNERIKIDNDCKGCVITNLCNDRGKNESFIGPRGEEIIAFDLWFDVSDTLSHAQCVLAERGADFTIDHYRLSMSLKPGSTEYDIDYESYDDGECESINTAREFDKDSGTFRSM